MHKNIGLCLLFIFFMTISSCTRTRIEGKVLDGFGKPVRDVFVKIDGTQFSAKTNGYGEYSVGYVPGNIKVSISKDGYTDTSFSANIATETKYPAESVVIYEVPKEVGIYLMLGEQYKLISKCDNIKKISIQIGGGFGMSLSDVYFAEFDENNITSIKLKDSLLRFLDCEPRPISLFRLIKNVKGNAILVRSTDGGGAGFMIGDHSDKVLIVDEKYQQFKKGERNVTLRFAKLDEGLYAFAQYDKIRSPAITGELSVFKVVK